MPEGYDLVIPGGTVVNGSGRPGPGRLIRGTRSAAVNDVRTIRQVGVDTIMLETDFPHPACLLPDGLDDMADTIVDMTRGGAFHDMQRQCRARL